METPKADEEKRVLINVSSTDTSSSPSETKAARSDEGTTAITTTYTYTPKLQKPNGVSTISERRAKKDRQMSERKANCVFSFKV